MTIVGSDLTLQAQSAVSSRPSHHPPEELLIDYASGALLESESLLIALHLGMCRDCQAVFNESLAIGGVLLDALTPSKLPPGLLNRTLAALDSESLNKKTVVPKAAPGFGSHWPAPLRRYIDENRLKKWRWLPAGFRALRIPCGDDNSGRVWLMKAPPGRGPFHHNHVQDEWTVVLEGGFSDETGTYGVGDFGYAAAGDAHHPIAEPGEGLRVPHLGACDAGLFDVAGAHSGPLHPSLELNTIRTGVCAQMRRACRPDVPQSCQARSYGHT